MLEGVTAYGKSNLYTKTVNLFLQSTILFIIDMLQQQTTKLRASADQIAKHRFLHACEKRRKRLGRKEYAVYTTKKNVKGCF